MPTSNKAKDYAKEKARMGYWSRQSKKRFKTLLVKQESLFGKLEETMEDKMNYALRIDDLQLRLVTTQGELMKSTISFLSTMNQMQKECFQLRVRRDESSREILDLKRKLTNKEKKTKTFQSSYDSLLITRQEFQINQ